MMIRVLSPLLSTSLRVPVRPKFLASRDLLDAAIDRSADILERIGAEVDQVSHSIFEPEEEAAPPSYNDVLKALGRKGDLTSKVRETWYQWAACCHSSPLKLAL